jgi:N-acetylneuraminic acid mutarotase
VDVYNPASDAWSALAAPLPVALSYSDAAAAGGDLYVFGGWTCNLCADRRAFRYDVRSGSWIRLADAPIPIYGGVARVLGGQIYMTTGNCCGSTNALLVYDPATNRWTRLAGPPHAHDFPAGGGVIAGKFYVAGGEGAHGSLDVYDPATNAWIAMATMPAQRQHGSGVVIDGKLYIFGGTEVAGAADAVDVLAYDPSSNTWSTTTQLPTARNLPAAMLLGGRAYIAGGTTSDGATPLTTVEAFSATTNPQPVASILVRSTTSSTRLVAGRTLAMVAAVFDGNGALLVGRRITWQSSDGHVATVDANGVVTGIEAGSATISATSEGVTGAITIFIDSPWSTGASMPTARWGESVGVVGNTIYVIGGLTGNEQSPVATNTVESWDAVNGWRSLPPIPFGSVFHAPSVAYNGSIYVFGGWTCGTCVYVYNTGAAQWTRLHDAPHNISLGVALAYHDSIWVTTGYDGGSSNRLDVYDPTTDTWRSLPGSPDYHPAPAGAGFIDGKFYLAGGEGSHSALDVYDPVLQTWRTVGTLPVPRQHGVGAVINNRLYLFGGSDAGITNIPTAVLAYDPATNAWWSGASMPTAVNIPGAAFLNGSMYVIGGGLHPGDINWGFAGDLLQIFTP